MEDTVSDDELMPGQDWSPANTRRGKTVGGKTFILPDRMLAELINAGSPGLAPIKAYSDDLSDLVTDCLRVIKTARQEGPLVWETDLSDLSLETLSVLRELLVGLTTDLNRETANRAVAAGLPFDSGIEELVLAETRADLEPQAAAESPQDPISWARRFVEAKLGPNWVRVRVVGELGFQDCTLSSIPEHVLLRLKDAQKGAWVGFDVEVCRPNRVARLQFRDWKIPPEKPNLVDHAWFPGPVQLRVDRFDGKLMAYAPDFGTETRILWSELVLLAETGEPTLSSRLLGGETVSVTAMIRKSQNAEGIVIHFKDWSV